MIENIKKIVKELQGDIQTLYIDTNDNRRDKAKHDARNNIDYLMTAVYGLARIPDEASTQIQELIADNKRLREENEWQPIETAPKDGTAILAFSRSSRMQGIIQWEADKKSPRGGYWVGVAMCTSTPTHWKPRHEPPKELI